MTRGEASGGAAEQADGGGPVFEKGGLLCFTVRVQPRAGRLGFAGWHGKALKVRLTAPPAEDRANRQLVDFVASRLGVAKSSLRLVSGPRSRDKTLGVQGLGRAKLENLLKSFGSSGGPAAKPTA